MSLAALIRSMAAAGAPPEAIALAVEALEAAQVRPPRGASAERMARKRARDREGVTGDADVTSQVTPRDAHAVTDPLPLPLSPQTPQTPTPSPGEGSTRARETTPQRRAEIALLGEALEARAALPKPTPKVPKPSRRCPNSWTPTPADLAVGAQLGMTPGAMERALSTMRDHEFQAPKTDWSATFRNWLRRDAPHDRPGPHPPRTATDDRATARTAVWSQLAAEEDRARAGGVT